MTAARPPALEWATFEWWHLAVAVLTTAGPVIAAAAVLIAVYWIIRRAVAGGIRDAGGARAGRGRTRHDGRSTPTP